MAHRKRLPSFELARSELENIKAVGGVVLLVASIPKDDPDQKTPYFADLTPSNVDSLLEQMPKTQSAKSVPLREFPMEIQDVYNYIKHLQQRQRKKALSTPVTPLYKMQQGLRYHYLTILILLNRRFSAVLGASQSSPPVE